MSSFGKIGFPNNSSISTLWELKPNVNCKASQFPNENNDAFQILQLSLNTEIQLDHETVDIGTSLEDIAVGLAT